MKTVKEDDRTHGRSQKISIGGAILFDLFYRFPQFFINE